MSANILVPIVARHFEHGEKMLMQGNLDAALPHLLAAYKLAPDAPLSLYGYAMGCLAAQDFAQAETLFKRLLSKQETAQAHYHLGCAFRGQAKWLKAERAFRRCLDIEPTHVNALLELAHLRAFAGDWTEMTSLHDRALAIESDRPQVRYSQSLVRLARGDYERGWRDYECRFDAPYLMIGWSHDGVDMAKKWDGSNLRTEAD